MTTPVDAPSGSGRLWYSTADVAALLGYGTSKVKDLIATRRLRSVKDGKYRRIRPEWVQEYIERVSEDQEERW